MRDVLERIYGNSKIGTRFLKKKKIERKLIDG